VTIAMQGPAIAAEGLEKTYGKSVHALRGVGLRVEQGTVFGLLGPNGAGKSTTVKVLTTLTRPESGTARVAGVDLLRQPQRVRRLIGCVAQRDAVDLEATARENLMLQGQLYDMPGTVLRRRVQELLERFQLVEAADRVARTLSGGMLRKVAVALGLVHRPQVLFLDEPTAGLDPQARAEMWLDIRGLVERDGVSVLLTTHHLDEADHLADRVAIIDRGRVVAEGPPEELKKALRGDAIHVELDAEATAAAALRALERLNGRLHDVTGGARTLHARVDDGASAVPSVLAALENAGVRVAAVTMSRPSLDDVYLQHTGRTFRAAEQGESR
jgi:ABC-2 type transport system ATP-binding protein